MAPRAHNMNRSLFTQEAHEKASAADSMLQQLKHSIQAHKNAIDALHEQLQSKEREIGELNATLATMNELKASPQRSPLRESTAEAAKSPHSRSSNDSAQLIVAKERIEQLSVALENVSQKCAYISLVYCLLICLPFALCLTLYVHTQTCVSRDSVYSAQSEIMRLRKILSAGGASRPIPVDAVIQTDRIAGLCHTETDTALSAAALSSVSRGIEHSQLMAEEALHEAIMQLFDYLKTYTTEDFAGVYDRLFYVYERYPVLLSALQKDYPVLYERRTVAPPQIQQQTHQTFHRSNVSAVATLTHQRPVAQMETAQRSHVFTQSLSDSVSSSLHRFCCSAAHCFSS